MLSARLLCFVSLLAISGWSATVNQVVLCTSQTTCENLVGKTDLPVSFVGSTSDGNVTLSMTGFADSTFGKLRAASSYSLTGPTATWTQYQAMTEASETFIVNSEGHAGEAGWLQLSYLVTGSESVNGLAGLDTLARQ
jgi:hypothetical protein